MNIFYIFSLISLLFPVGKVLCLECYVCDNQEDNNGKCVNTIVNCESNQDVCLTEIKWGSTPYWSQGAKKQYYVSKRCSNRTECTSTRQRNMPLCTHIWYQDWVCSDCCLGDRCNYYIIREDVDAASYICSKLMKVWGWVDWERMPVGIKSAYSGSSILRPTSVVISAFILFYKLIF